MAEITSGLLLRVARNEGLLDIPPDAPILRAEHREELGLQQLVGVGTDHWLGLPPAGDEPRRAELNPVPPPPSSPARRINKP